MPTTLTIILVLSCVLEDYNIHISSLNRKLKYQMMALCHTYLRKKNWLPIPLVSHSKNWLDPNSLVIYNHIYLIRSYFYDIIVENTQNQLIYYAVLVYRYVKIWIIAYLEYWDYSGNYKTRILCSYFNCLAPFTMFYGM